MIDRKVFMKRKVTIREFRNPFGAHTITIGNARFLKCFAYSVDKILKYFFDESELFFELYRTDGINLTFEKEAELKKEIPVFFKEHGDFQELNEYLTIAKIKVDNYSFIPSIFDYYLETTILIPKVRWEFFEHYVSNYHNHSYEAIVINHFADVVFGYYDSGDFLICFNPQIYNSCEIKSMMADLFNDE